MGFYSYGFYNPALTPATAPCGPWATSVWGGFLSPYVWPGATGAGLNEDLLYAIGHRAVADPVLGPLLPGGINSFFTGVLPPRQVFPAVSIEELGSNSQRSTSPLTYIKNKLLQVTFVAPTAAGAKALLGPWESCFRPQMTPLLFDGGTLLGMFCTSDNLLSTDVQGVTGGTTTTRLYMLVCDFTATIQRNLPS